MNVDKIKGKITEYIFSEDIEKLHDSQLLRITSLQKKSADSLLFPKEILIKIAKELLK